MYELNIFSVLAAAGGACALGFLWYSPMMFYPTWSRLLKIDKLSKKEMSKGMGLIMGTMIVQCIAQAYVMALVFSLIPGLDIWVALFWAVLLWFGLGGGMIISNGLFAMMRKKVLLIDAGYRLVAMSVMAVMLVVLGL